MTLRPLLLCFALLAGCSFAPESRPLVAVALTGRPAAKLTDKQVQALFSATNREVTAGGFHGPADQQQSHGYTLTGGPLYRAGFLWLPGFGCSSTFSDRQALVRFYEYAQPNGSGRFVAPEAQRRAVRALAARIEASLRRSVPTGFEVQVGVEFPSI